MRAMNALRRFLLRGGRASRMSILAALAVLLVRALLPGAVMLDPETTAQGGFALVMCSGHGPLFGHDTGATSHMADMDMSHMPDMNHDDMDMPGMSNMSHMSDMPGPADHGSMTADDGLCAFSAALFVACLSVAIAVALFTLEPTVRIWRAPASRLPDRLPRYFRLPSRAPPLFS
jgi:hypothetical protein